MRLPRLLAIVALLGPVAAAGQDWESRLLAVPRPDNMREAMRRLSARPHHVGSAYGRESAEWILARFREWGWDAEIETFDVLFPTPKERLVEMTAPTRFRLALEEPALAVDPTSGRKAEQLPTYNAYSIDGDVTGPLVYVNYGLPEDYEQLDRLGISVKGKVVLARYGRSWRGIKPKVAAEHGAVGCLIYSDPRDDGYFEGDVFPKGPMRPKDGVQRGSVMDFPSSSPGDPLTPGVGATKEAKRLAISDAPSLTRIPVLPISYGDAQPLLAALEGPMAPTDWRGALAIPYHVGPGPTTVRLKVAFNWDIKPVHDVVARIPGAERPDEWIVRGNHHDAWVNGAEDPISALVAMLEEARAFGLLLKEGWRPRRTPRSCDRRPSRTSTPTPPAAATWGWPAPTPSSGSSTRSRGRSRTRRRRSRCGRGRRRGPWPTPRPPRSGGRSASGRTCAWARWARAATTRRSSTTSASRASTSATAARTTAASTTPSTTTSISALADATQEYLADLKRLLQRRQEETSERNRLIDDGVFPAILDPRRPTVAPPKEEVPPHLEFAPLENAVDALQRSAARYAKARAGAEGRGLPADVLSRVNALLMRSERVLLSPEGLPRRPWFKHLLYAPGVYAGYGAKTMPGAREAIELKRYSEADAEIARIARALEEESALANEAAAELEKAASRQ